MSVPLRNRPECFLTRKRILKGVDAGPDKTTKYFACSCQWADVATGISYYVPIAGNSVNEKLIEVWK